MPFFTNWLDFPISFPAAGCHLMRRPMGDRCAALSNVFFAIYYCNLRGPAYTD
jgi:hypothetical protein